MENVKIGGMKKKSHTNAPMAAAISTGPGPIRKGRRETVSRMIIETVLYPMSCAKGKQQRATMATMADARIYCVMVD